MARIGIYGGSFNPPHLGHIFAARKARQLLELDKILLIPAAIPPHKAVAEGSPDGETRFALTQLAIAGETGMEVSRIELDRPGPSYTVDTLHELRESYPQDGLYLLMGTDMFLSFFQWREPEAIAALAVPVCMARVRADAALSAQLLAQQKKMEAVFGVADHEGRRTDMVGDDAERHVGLVGLLIVCAGDLGDFIRDVHDSVDVEQGRDVLTHAGKAFEAHAGVDVLLLEFGIIAVAVVIELGEDDVPDLDIAVTVAADGAAGLAAAVLLAAVIIDLGARAARAGAMLPEVILLAEAEDAVLGNADHVTPDGEGLVVGRRRLVARKDRRIQTVRLKADPLRAGQKFPCPGNGFLLEVIAEGEVAEHLKIGAVTGRMADVFNVAGADALLTGGDAVARRLFLAGEPRLHGSHARVDQQDGFVVLRNERKARQTQMALRFKELQVHLAQLIETVCLVCHDEILLLYTLKIKRYTVPETALGSPYGRAVAAGD